VDIGRKLQALDSRLAKVERSARLSHAAIDNTAVVVKDSTGGLRGIIGVQADGTTAVNIVNGAAPAQPSPPIVASVLGGVTVSWDGTFADGSVLPLDWARIEVHASILASYEPVPATLQGTIETAQGATVVVPCDTPVYVRLVARNTSGTASTPSAIVGPFGPTPVVADDIVDSIVTTLKLADDAVTQAKVAVGAIGSTELQAGAVLEEKLAANAVTQGKLADQAVSTLQLADDAVTNAKVAVNAIDSTSIQDGAISTPKLAALAVQAGNIAADAVAAGKIAADAITSRELAANSVTAAELSAGSVTAAAVAAGAITTDKLTVTGGSNLLSDPSFEGAYSAALVSANSNFSIDPTGNGSSKSLKVNAAAASATTRSLKITTVPILAGDQLYVATDYLTSSDYTSTAIVKFYARWENSAGTTIGFGVAQASPPVIGGSTWSRISNTVTAPAGTIQATIWAESVNASAGSVWWDNAAVRPVAASTQIQDGAITTSKVAALAITAAQIAADAVAAGKIAADAVTAREIAALAVTAAEIAANAITVGKIQAGAVDATALAADAITGKTITGGTINGTTITGGTMQTATTGERITLNESAQNKVLVYNSSGTAINELSSRGLLVKGSTGATIWLNPNISYPQLQLYNAGNTNYATVQVTETNTGEANLEQFCGPFAGNTYSDMIWRTFLSPAGASMERLRASDPNNVRIGGRVALTETQALLQLGRTDDPTQTTSLAVEANKVSIIQGILSVSAPASTSSLLYANAATGQSGNLLRLQLNSVDKFFVDKDGNSTTTGNATISGNATVTGSLTVTGIGHRETKRRTSDTTRANTTTPTSDSQITFTVDANAVYVIDGFLKYSGPGDFLMGWTIPTGALGEWQGIGNGTTVASEGASNAFQNDVVTSFGYTVRTETTDIASTRTYGGVGSTTFGVQVRGTVRVGSTGGTFALQWAQGTSNATGTVLYTDSHLRLEKVG
jgi:hypothetical protein